MAIVMVAVTVVIYIVLDSSGLGTQHLSHSVQITTRLNQAENTLGEAETEERDYILSGNKKLLELYDNLSYTKNTDINPDSLLAFMPEYAPQVNRLNQLVYDKISFAANIITAVNNGKKQQAVDLLNTGRSRLLMDTIKRLINNIQVAENNRLNDITAKEISHHNNIFTLLCFGILTCLLLLIIFYQMILRNTRLREKTEADLVEAKNMAEAANRAKTTFLTTMSQEIRTPMHDIISTASLLADTILTDEQQKYAGIIQRSSLALLAVVNDIIDFSNIETGRIPLENYPFVLRDCLEEVLTTAGADNIDKINYRIDGSLPQLIDCDPVRLRQVLMTITGNSIKNNTSGRVDCNVRLILEVDNILDIEFTITSMPATQEPLHGVLAGATNDALFGMSSIRFSIAARLVSLMGGSLKVTTNTGGGNSIAFSIKANKVDGKSSDKYLNRRKDIQWLDNELASKIPLHILVVDDHEVNQALLVQILTKMGYSCKTARNGVEAAGMAIEEKFDVVFMDIAMPVMDGIDATKRIREYYVHTDTPLIIGVTANALYSEKQKGFDAGMNDFLIKPYKPIDIQNMLKKWTALVFKLKYDAPAPKGV